MSTEAVDAGKPLGLAAMAIAMPVPPDTRIARSLINPMRRQIT